MKKLIVSTFVTLSATALLTGCIGLQLGGGSTTKETSPTAGQQLIDLQAAKNSGAISEAEYQAERNKVLNAK